MINILLRKRILIILVATIGISITAVAQLSLRTWTGVHSNHYSDWTNWSPAGMPVQTDSIVIPATYRDPEMTNGQSTSIGSLHILGYAKLSIQYAVNLNVQGPLVIDREGVLQITANMCATTGDVVVNGQFKVTNGKAPQFLCRGDLILGASAIFCPANSNFVFRNPTKIFALPSLTVHDLVVDSAIAMVTTGNIQVDHQLVVDAPLWMRSQDTISITSGDTSALVGTAKISRGTISRTVTQAVALGGGTYRFHDAKTAINFLSVGTLPTNVTMTSIPGVFPQNLDTTRIFKHYYDIHQVNGSGFRLRLSFEYDPSEAGVIASTEQYAIYRSPDYGTTWIEIPASSFDTVTHVISSDNITGFSRYAFGRLYAAPTDVERETNIASEFTLSQNYPNPFNPMTVIRYQLPVASTVTLRLYDATGQLVNFLVDEVQDAGERMIGVNGEGLASGVYFYKFEAIGVADHTKLFAKTGKMILVK